MSHRVTAVVLIVLVALLVAVASLLWAQTMTPKGGDFQRCLTTCNTVIKYYGEKRPTLKTHEGDKQCWQTCAARFGQGKNLGSTNAMKTFWAERRTTHLHANQCAQACWRKFHNGSEIVRVAGMNSQPRAVACAPGGNQQAMRSDIRAAGT